MSDDLGIRQAEIIDRQRELLAAASITISSWRWKLADAGHPFREPPGVSELLKAIDRAVFPHLADKNETLRGKPAPLSRAAVAAGEALKALHP